MSIDTNRIWEAVGKWSAAAFLVAGGLVSIATVALGLVLVTDMSQGVVTGLPSMVGLLISYVGMLGLYPRLADRRRRSALTSVVLLLVPVIGLAYWLGHALVIGQEPSYAGLLVGVVFVGFVSGITLLGVTSYLSQVPSRGVGLALMAFAVPWVVLLGSGMVYGGAAPVWLDFVTTGMMAVLLLVIGYLSWTGPQQTKRQEVTPDLSG